MFPVGLCEWKITDVHPTLTIMFKEFLRTFEAEILKIFKNIPPQCQVTVLIPSLFPDLHKNETRPISLLTCPLPSLKQPGKQF